ncbi:PDC sensor domain-containing protein [Methylomarinum sp. Ch1-1]|uniref:PDC sensor domain-containing protein n=1 Tax=Methylomarinum roseum TaxID=3067653 RepID=A0AAU7NZE0_9GAMM|nr:PDC sensor domain-containing protein [Methylomarinum sp. Ch1-1]MDP4521565.1 PDC sensor domain-containing protein [Methylomarinum sp. Ch1-1]
MSKMSHINVIEKYDEHRDAIHHLLSSILSCFADAKMFEQNQQELSEQLKSLCDYYPFISLLYLLDAKGKQISMNVPGSYFKHSPQTGRGFDRSKRPYYLLAANSDSVVITEPYLSSVRRELCLSATIKMNNDDGTTKGYIVLDIDLAATISFLTGDSKRIHFDPYFKAVYSLIVVGLFSVALLLLYLAGKECWEVLQTLLSSEEGKLLPFGVVIYLTLALAIFDLGKTTLEEEVLLYKDILRHSSTRRTITRFIAAIIIAVSIEALLMIFKSALKESGEYIIQAVWIILAAGFLLLCMAVYVYLGSKAEALLLKRKNHKDS